MSAWQENSLVLGQMLLSALAGIFAMISANFVGPLMIVALWSLLAGSSQISGLVIFVWASVASYAACRNVPALLALMNDADRREWTLVALWSTGSIAICPFWWIA